MTADTLDVLPARNQQDIERVLAAAKRLVVTVSSILDVSKMEAGKLVPKLSACNVVALAADTAKELSSLAGDRALSVDSPAESVLVKADGELIARVIQNLLANALKFTPAKGTIRIGIEEQPGAVCVSVTDTGPGIPADQHDRIFEKFSQVEARRAGQPFASSGLGLAFCKMAVEAHGGQIGVISQEGKGSTFWFKLPRRGDEVDS